MLELVVAPAVERGGAARRVDEPEQRAQRRALARAVRAEKPGTRPASTSKLRFFGLDLAEALGKVADLDGGHRGHHGASLRRTLSPRPGSAVRRRELALERRAKARRHPHVADPVARPARLGGDRGRRLGARRPRAAERDLAVRRAAPSRRRSARPTTPSGRCCRCSRTAAAVRAEIPARSCQPIGAGSSAGSSAATARRRGRRLLVAGEHEPVAPPASATSTGSTCASARRSSAAGQPVHHFRSA